MAKTGPRRKARATKLSKMVSVLFTTAEFKQVQAAAGEQSVSSYIRERTLAGPLEDAEPSELHELRKQAEHVLRRLDEVEKVRGGKGNE